MKQFFQQTRRFHTPGRAFTLIELLLVLVILGILAAVIVPKFMHRPEQAKITKALADVKTIETTVEMFNIDNGRYPSPDEGLLILTENISDLPNWKGPYLDYKPDPWDNDYLYQFPGQFHPASYDILSVGPDLAPNTPDDIHN